jgi:hypothetical protein
MSENLYDYLNDADYKFFNEIYNFENKINKLFKPNYSLEIKLSNYNDIWGCFGWGQHRSFIG